MCGIVGVVSKETQGHHISLMVEGLLHRGPDAHGVFVNESRTVSLGHTRLSIIDVRSIANQPFHSNDGRYVIVFNGEIYNFQSLKLELAERHAVTFRTNSDTEVIVEGFSVWKEKIAEKLQGMFAFAIVDKQTDKIHLFRDRVGKKPLYYFKSEELFAFASEIKSLLKHPLIQKQIHVQKESISTFLHLGYIPEPLTVYADIFKFPAGSYGEIDRTMQLRERRYWRLQDTIGSAKLERGEEAKPRLKDILNTVVGERLISDVPVGAFLSGGTDSSLVSAIASRHTASPLKTFSIGFKESKFDERRFAREVASHLGTDHMEYILAEKEASDILETYLHHFDEPFADTSAIPTMLVSKLAREKVKVALTGDGGDELFQGYGSYAWANRLNSPFIKAIRQPLQAALKLSGKSRFERIAHVLEPARVGNERSHIFSQEQYFFSQAEIRNELLVNKNIFNVFAYADPSEVSGKLIPGEKQALFDFNYYLKDDLLVKVDRASMFYALECRSPLLDHRVAEFAFSLHPSLKIKGGTSKWILKELLKEYIPEALVYRQKWGFSVPLGTWLKNDLRYLLDQYLNERCLLEVGLFNVEYVAKLKHQFLNGKDYLYNRLWVIIVLQKWMKENSHVFA